jgi:methyl-accepting chemotaxis protein
MQQVADGMNEIKISFEESFKSASDILIKSQAINEIAEIVNILAINAAIEAGRAGEFGKGFNVIASEIRELAGNTQRSAQVINNLSQQSIKKLTHTNNLILKIVPEIKESLQISSEIFIAGKEQSSGISQMNQAVMQFSSVIQQNTALAEELATSAEELNSQSQLMVEKMSFFKIKEGEESNEHVEKEKIEKPLFFVQNNDEELFGNLSNDKSKSKTQGVKIDLNSPSDDAFENY